MAGTEISHTFVDKRYDEDGAFTGYEPKFTDGNGQAVSHTTRSLGDRGLQLGLQEFTPSNAVGSAAPSVDYKNGAPQVFGFLEPGANVQAVVLRNDNSTKPKPGMAHTPTVH